MTVLEEDRKTKFLALLREGETGAGACRALGVTEQTMRRLRRKDRQFAADWEAALTVKVEERRALQLSRSAAAYHPPSSLPAASAEGKRTPTTRHLLLAALAEGASVSRACDEAGISYQTVRLWRKDDAEFEQAVIDAVNQGIDRLEDEARRRAVDGYEEQVLNGKGEVVQTYRRYSDNLLALMLKSKIAYYRPDQTKININTTGGGTVNVTVVGIASGEFIDEVDEGVTVIEGQPQEVPVEPVQEEGASDSTDEIPSF